jgi:hypothetical protein
VLPSGSAGVSGGIEQPAVEQAAQAAVFDAAIGEVGAAMRAVAIDHAERAGLVTEQDGILPQQADGLDRPVALQLLGQRGRLPVPAQQRAGRGARARPGHQVVLLGAHHRNAPSYYHQCPITAHYADFRTTRRSLQSVCQ